MAISNGKTTSSLYYNRPMIIVNIIRGLSGMFVDTACFHWLLCTFQTSLICYNSVTQKWIKYKADSVLCHIYTRLLLLWQRRVEVTGARQNVFNLKYQILYINFNNIISERENVVKLHIDVRWTSNVTCGKFGRRHDSNINVIVFCCRGQNVDGFTLSSCRPSVSRALLKWHKRFSDGSFAKIMEDLAVPLLLIKGRWR